MAFGYLAISNFKTGFPDLTGIFLVGEDKRARACHMISPPMQVLDILESRQTFRLKSCRCHDPHFRDNRASYDLILLKRISDRGDNA